MADFFEVGKTYYETWSHTETGSRSRFEVKSLSINPVTGAPVAFGWWYSVVFGDAVGSTMEQKDFDDFEEISDV